MFTYPCNVIRWIHYTSLLIPSSLRKDFHRSIFLTQKTSFHRSKNRWNLHFLCVNDTVGVICQVLKGPTVGLLGIERIRFGYSEENLQTPNRLDMWITDTVVVYQHVSYSQNFQYKRYLYNFDRKQDILSKSFQNSSSPSNI